MNLIRKRERAPRKPTTDVVPSKSKKTETPKKKKKIDSFTPVSPIRSETIKKTKKKKRVYYNKVEFDETEFEIGDDVYVKRREDSNSDE